MKTKPTEALKLIDETESIVRDIDIEAVTKLFASLACKLAFKEGQSNPKIRQLEWRYDEEFFIWEANSVFGKYSFVDNSLIVNKKLFFRGKEIAIVLTIDEAKAAAQADFEKRIKECLE